MYPVRIQQGKTDVQNGGLENGETGAWLEM